MPEKYKYRPKPMYSEGVLFLLITMEIGYLQAKRIP
jgi:hypothetical protein